MVLVNRIYNIRPEENLYSRDSFWSGICQEGNCLHYHRQYSRLEDKGWIYCRSHYTAKKAKYYDHSSLHRYLCARSFCRCTASHWVRKLRMMAAACDVDKYFMCTTSSYLLQERLQQYVVTTLRLSMLDRPSFRNYFFPKSQWWHCSAQEMVDGRGSFLNIRKFSTCAKLFVKNVGRTSRLYCICEICNVREPPCLVLW